MTLEELNARIYPTYRLTKEELDGLLVLEENFQRPELYRSALRKIERRSRTFRHKEPSVRAISRFFKISKDSAYFYLSTCGAWGRPRVLPYNDEELVFMREMCRPEKYREYIDESVRAGYEPPTLPPDCYDRYIMLRRIRDTGRQWHEDGRLTRTGNAKGTERRRFGVIADRITRLDCGTSPDYEANWEQGAPEEEHSSDN